MATLLGINTNTWSPEDRALSKWILQSSIARSLPDERVSWCLRRLKEGAGVVRVLRSVDLDSVHYGGLIVCGSVWMCPICASKITERRKNELLQVEKNFSGGLYMASFTVSHALGDSLAVVDKKVSSSLRRVFSGKGWQVIKKEFGIFGYVSSVEVTYGNNGWHAHRHVLFFCNDWFPMGRFEILLKRRYHAALEAGGGSASWRRGCVVSDAREYQNEICDYVIKWGISSEVAKAPMKRARGENLSVWEVAFLGALCGEVKYLTLWLEYVGYYKGKKQLFYSKGTRKMLGLDVELSDLEIAANQDEKAELLAVISTHLWNYIVNKVLRGAVVLVAKSEPEKLEQYLLDLLRQVPTLQAKYMM